MPTCPTCLDLGRIYVFVMDQDGARREWDPCPDHRTKLEASFSPSPQGTEQQPETD